MVNIIHLASIAPLAVTNIPRITLEIREIEVEGTLTKQTERETDERRIDSTNE